MEPRKAFSTSGVCETQENAAFVIDIRHICFALDCTSWRLRHFISSLARSYFQGKKLWKEINFRYERGSPVQVTDHPRPTTNWALSAIFMERKCNCLPHAGQQFVTGVSDGLGCPIINLLAECSWQNWLFSKLLGTLNALLSKNWDIRNLFIECFIFPLIRRAFPMHIKKMVYTKYRNQVNFLHKCTLSLTIFPRNGICFESQNIKLILELDRIP